MDPYMSSPLPPRFENGFIMDPYVLAPHNTVADLLEIKRTEGYSSVPITDTGKMGGKLVGIVTSRDIDFLKGDAAVVKLSDVMTKKLSIGKEPITLKEANKLLQKSKKGRKDHPQGQTNKLLQKSKKGRKDHPEGGQQVKLQKSKKGRLCCRRAMLSCSRRAWEERVWLWGRGVLGLGGKNCCSCRKARRRWCSC